MPIEDRIVPHPDPALSDKYWVNLDTRDVIDRATHKVVPRPGAAAPTSPQQEATLPGGGRDLSTRVLTPEQQQAMLQQTGMGSLQTLPTAQGVSPKPTLENVRDISGVNPITSWAVDPAIDLAQGSTLGHVVSQYGVRPGAQMTGEAIGGAIGGKPGAFIGGVAAPAAMDIYDKLKNGELTFSTAAEQLGMQALNNLLGHAVGQMGTGPSKTREPFVETGKGALEEATVKKSNVEAAETTKQRQQLQEIPEQMREVQRGIGEKGKEVSWQAQAEDVAGLGKRVAKAQTKGEKELAKVPTVEEIADADVKKVAEAQASDEFAQWYKGAFGRDLHEGQEEGRKLAAGEFTPAGTPLPQEPMTRESVWRPFQAIFQGVRGVREGFTKQYEDKVKPELEGKFVPSEGIEGLLHVNLAKQQREGTAPPLHTPAVNMFLGSLMEQEGREDQSPIVNGPHGERAYPAEWLLGRASELAQLLHSRSTPEPEKHILGLVKEEFDKHLNKLSPSYGETTAQYANTARIGLFDLANEVGRAERGLDIPQIIFSRPEAANLMVSRMGDQEKAQLRELTGLSMARAYAGQEPPSTLKTLLNADNETAYKNLGLPDMNGLVRYAKGANEFGDAIVKDPALRQQAQQAVEQKARDTLDDFSRQSAASFEANLKDWAKGTDSKSEWARNTLRQIAPLKDGRQKMFLLDQAIQKFMPSAKAGLPSDFTGAPELVKATRGLISKLPAPVAQEYQARFQQAESLNDQLAIVRELGNAQNLPQGVKDAVAVLQKHFTPLDGLTAQELDRMYRSKYGEPPIAINTPKDYAVAKMMRNDTSIPKSWFEKSLGFHLALGGLLSWVGHTPVWLAAEAIVGAGDKIRNTARKSFGESLRNEDEARKFIDGLDNFQLPSGKEKLLRQFAGAAVSSMLDDAENYVGVKP